MTDMNHAMTAGGIRTVELSREYPVIRAKRPPRSIVAEPDGIITADGGTTFATTPPSGVTEDNGLILATYSVPGDAQPTDSASNAGGALILHAHLELVFWGTAWQSISGPSAADVVNAVTTLLGSPYLLGLAQYGFQDAAVRGSTIVTSPAPPVNYSTDDPMNLVWSLIDDGKFPEPDDTGGRILYIVFMPPGTNPPAIPNANPPANALGAHSDPSDYDFPADVERAWAGFVSYGTLDYMTTVFSHEFVESVTDPEPNGGPAWLMSRSIGGGNEIGDACNNTIDYLNGVMVQAYWSQRQRACVIPQARGTLAVLTSLEQGVKVQGGGTGEAVVSLNQATPIDVTVTLSSDNLAVLTVPDSLTIPAGRADGLVPLTAGIVPGPYQFVAIHAFYRGSTVATQVQVTPHPSVLSGVVTDAAGHPVVQAIVEIDNGDVSGSGHWQLTTGANGSYTTGTVVPGSYTIDVTASGYVPAQRTVVITEGVPVTGEDFSLEARRPSTISGTVRDPAGAAVAGAQVVLLQQDREQSVTATTDGTGSFRMSVDQGYYTGGYWLTATAPGYADGFADLGTIANGADLSEAIVLAKLGSLAGSVTDSSHTPPVPIAEAGVRVAITTNDPLTPGSYSVMADAAGHYQLQLPPGPASLTIKAGGFETYTATVTVPAGGTVTADAGLVPASASLACTVSAASTGNPIGDAIVSVTGGTRGPVTHDGAYTVVRIPAGPQQITIHAPGYKPVQDKSWVFVAHQTISVDFIMDSVQPGPNPPPPHWT